MVVVDEEGAEKNEITFFVKDIPLFCDTISRFLEIESLLQQYIYLRIR